MHMRYRDCVALVFTDTHIYMELERQSNTHVKRFIYKENTRNNNKLISIFIHPDIPTQLHPHGPL